MPAAETTLSCGNETCTNTFFLVNKPTKWGANFSLKIRLANSSPHCNLRLFCKFFICICVAVKLALSVLTNVSACCTARSDTFLSSLFNAFNRAYWARLLPLVARVKLICDCKFKKFVLASIRLSSATTVPKLLILAW